MARLTEDNQTDTSMEDLLSPPPAAAAPRRRINPLTGEEEADQTIDAPVWSENNPASPPPVASPAAAPPVNQNPYFDPGTNITPGQDIPLKGNGAAPAPGAAAPAAGFDTDAGILAQIGKWAAMPGADPSLGADPNYWLGEIKKRGGLSASNLQYWQDAGVGPTAFFNNPNRESGGSGGGANTVAAASGGGDLSSFLMSLLQGQGAGTSAARNTLLSKLSALADKYSQPVTADDPNVKGATDAYTGQVGRSVNRFRKTAAERAYAEGVPSGAFDSQIGNAELSGGRSVGDFETTLMHDEMLSRRNALMQTIQQSGSLLSAQDASDIQNKIAGIDAALKSRGMDITENLGFKGLDLQKLLGQGSLDMQGRSLTNQNNQFYDQMGTNSAHDQALLKYLYEQLKLN